MLDIKRGEDGEIALVGRFDAAQEQRASDFFDTLAGPAVVNLRELAYISSLGLGILLRTQKRLKASTGGGLTLVHVNPHILDVLKYSGLTQVFEIRNDPAG